MNIWFWKKNKKFSYEIKEVFSKKDIDRFIYEWNNNYPIDRWYREKHGIAFNSPEHRVLSFIDIYIEWKEDKIFSELLKEKEEYKKGDWLHNYETDEEKISDDDLMQAFMNPDLKVDI